MAADDSKLRAGEDGGSIEQFVDRSRDPNVVGFLHRPASPAKDALLLTHGAGSNCRAQLLVDVAEAFAEAGMLVLRCDLPYRQSSPSGPPKPGTAERDREGLRNAVLVMRDLAMRDLAHGRIFLGGHSYGGRQASMLAASSPELVDGLVLLSYPLHPPRKPLQLRTQHFPELRTPALFVHGTRDPFGSEEELTDAVRVIPAGKELFILAGAGHDLKVGKKAEPTLARRVLERFSEFFVER
jgi:predicted alpha/beta-hydrolase family hydrolase